MKRIIMLMAVLASSNAWSYNLEFQNLSQADIEKIAGDFSANFAHTSVSGASSLGDLWGFEIGAIGSYTTTNEIDAIIKREGINANADLLANGALLGRVSVPMGLTFEISGIPTVGNDSFEFSNYGGAVMWTLPQPLPLELAVKGHYTKTSVTYFQPVNFVDTEVKYENSVAGLDLIASKSFLVVEPYVGIGYIKADGDFTVTGTSTIFNFTASQTASADDTGIEFFAGLEFSFFAKIALQYANRFGENCYTAKVSIGF